MQWPGRDARIVGGRGLVSATRQHALPAVADEESSTLAVPAVARAEDVHFTPDDVLLLCVKSQDTDRALVEIRAAGGGPPNPPILCCPKNNTNETPAPRYLKRAYRGFIVLPRRFFET